MTNPVDSTALAEAYRDGIDRGLLIAVERIAAVLAFTGQGDQRETLAQVAMGLITVETLAAAQQQFEEPAGSVH